MFGVRSQSHHVTHATKWLPSKPTQLLNMTIEIMDLPSKHGDFHNSVSSPEGIWMNSMFLFLMVMVDVDRTW